MGCAAAGEDTGLPESEEKPESDLPFLRSCRNTLSFTCTVVVIVNFFRYMIKFLDVHFLRRDRHRQRMSKIELQRAKK